MKESRKSAMAKAEGARLALLWVTVVGVVVVSAGVTAAEEPQAVDSTAASQAAIVNQYCVTCHSDRLRAGQLVLDGRDLADIGADGVVWEKVISKLRGGMMPPPRAPRPPSRSRDRSSPLRNRP